VWRGVQLSREDIIRRTVIEGIMCHGYLRFDAIEREFGIDFSDHFAFELERLRDLAEDGLIEMDEESISASGSGLLLLRVIAMVFDEYLPQNRPAMSYSKVI
jgi:oxygen-independent coproporphyrinogen-3 oxidase